MLKEKLALLCALCLFPCMVVADDFSLGFGGFVERSPYRGESWTVTPLPLIKYESKYFFVDMTAAGGYLYNGENGKLRLMVDYMPLSFDPGDSDNLMMKQIGKRRSTFWGGLSYMGWGKYGIFKAGLFTDLSGHYNGFKGQLGYGVRFTPTENITLLPEVGLLWYDKKHNDYYYGVSGYESLRSGYKVYKASSGINPYASLSVQFKFSERLKFTGKVQWHGLSSAAKNSPLVDKKSGGFVFMGLHYTF